MKFMCLSLSVAVVSCAKAPGPVTPVTPVQRQMIGLLEKFDRWDDNGDGHLTEAEVSKAEKITGYPPEKIVEFYDANGDKRISLREAQDGLNRFHEAEHAATRAGR